MIKIRCDVQFDLTIKYGSHRKDLIDDDEDFLSNFY